MAWTNLYLGTWTGEQIEDWVVMALDETPAPTPTAATSTVGFRCKLNGANIYIEAIEYRQALIPACTICQQPNLVKYRR